MDPVSIVKNIISLGFAIKKTADDMTHNRQECLELAERVNRLLPFMDKLRGKSKLELDALSTISSIIRLATVLQDANKFLSEIADAPSNSRTVFSKVLDIAKTAWNSADVVAQFSEINLKLDQILSEIGVLKIDKMGDQVSNMEETLNNLANRLRRQELQAAGVTGGMDAFYIEVPEIASPDDRRSHLGQGAFGITHRMRNIEDDGLYAVKRIDVALAEKNGVEKAKLKNEAKVLQLLSHEHIVRYFVSFFSKQEKYFNIVMELVTGGSLADQVTAVPVPSVEQIAQWMLQAASALKYMHSKDIWHRDITPENILLTDRSLVKIADMGLASIVTTAAVKMTRVGTSTYSSYEKNQDGMSYDGRDDMWALGCVMAELLTRKRMTGPISAPTDAEAQRRRDKLIVEASAVSPVLGGQILSRLLVPLQSTRATAAQLTTALECFTGGVGGAAATAQNLLLQKTAPTVVVSKEIKALVLALSAKSWFSSTKSQAARALCNLAMNAANEVAIAEAGAIPPLVQLLRDGTSGAKESAAGALRNLAMNAANKVTISELAPAFNT